MLDTAGCELNVTDGLAASAMTGPPTPGPSAPIITIAEEAANSRRICLYIDLSLLSWNPERNVKPWVQAQQNCTPAQQVTCKTALVSLAFFFNTSIALEVGRLRKTNLLRSASPPPPPLPRTP